MDNRGFNVPSIIQLYLNKVYKELGACNILFIESYNDKDIYSCALSQPFQSASTKRRLLFDADDTYYSYSLTNLERFNPTYAILERFNQTYAIDKTNLNGPGMFGRKYVSAAIKTFNDSKDQYVGMNCFGIRDRDYMNSIDITDNLAITECHDIETTLFFCYAKEFVNLVPQNNRTRFIKSLCNVFNFSIIQGWLPEISEEYTRSLNGDYTISKDEIRGTIDVLTEITLNYFKKGEHINSGGSNEYGFDIEQYLINYIKCDNREMDEIIQRYIKTGDPQNYRNLVKNGIIKIQNEVHKRIQSFNFDAIEGYFSIIKNEKKSKEKAEVKQRYELTFLNGCRICNGHVLCKTLIPLLKDYGVTEVADEKDYKQLFNSFIKRKPYLFYNLDPMATYALHREITPGYSISYIK